MSERFPVRPLPLGARSAPVIGWFESVLLSLIGPFQTVAALRSIQKSPQLLAAVASLDTQDTKRTVFR